jgi:hypothetical protein
MFAPNLCAWWKMFAAFEKYSRPTFAPEVNVCGLWKMFAPILCARIEMFAAFEKWSQKIKGRNQKLRKAIEQPQIPEGWKIK